MHDFVFDPPARVVFGAGASRAGGMVRPDDLELRGEALYGAFLRGSAYLAQYSARPIRRPDGAGPRHFADPVLAGGEIQPQPSLSELKRAPDMPWTWSE